MEWPVEVLEGNERPGFIMKLGSWITKAAFASAREWIRRVVQSQPAPRGR
jgi:hypothetical protein